MASLEKASIERCALDPQIAKHKGARSPLRWLPTELISLIFKFTNIPPPALFEDRSPPWALGQVCVRWRAIALAEPTLWYSINIQRAGRLPLDITFLGEEGSSETAIVDLLGVLAKHSARWQRLILKCPTWVYPTLYRIRNTLPLLRELRLNISVPAVPDDADLAASLEASADIFQVAPNLQAAYIDVPITMSVLLPTSQLQRFRGTWNSFSEALASCANLVECSLGYGFAGEVLAAAQTIVLPALLSLSLSETDILDYLHVPALQILYWEPYDESIDSLLPFLERVSCKLQKLVISQTQRSFAEDFEDLFSGVPALTHLGINSADPGSIDDLLSVLIKKDMLPKLASLAVALPPQNSAFDDDLFADVLQYRASSGYLRIVELWAAQPFSRQTLARIQPLGGQGLQVTLRDSNSISPGEDWRHFDMVSHQRIIGPHRRTMLHW
ncbi:hypothetical protein FB451DRAFT_1496226 [Mycena latifolia]|nr:hypothetical protein FB451DRAFT_1496226 [Mycena latifolia]